MSEANAVDGSGRSLSIFIHDRLSIIVTAIILTATIAAWIVSSSLMPLMMSYTSSGMTAGMESSGTMAGMSIVTIVPSLSLPVVGIFEVVWVISMAAMMFPAMIPMVLFYNKVRATEEPNVSLARAGGTSLFLAGYIVVYALFGVGAYLAIYGGLALSSSFPVPSTLTLIVPGVILVVTGIYQFSSLKNRCLSQCVSPFGFFATHSRKGLVGAFRMGLSHGAFCAGCCWAYMLVMLAVGAMSVPTMLALTGLVVVEKVVVRGSSWFNKSVGFGFVSLGVLVAVCPSVLSLV